MAEKVPVHRVRMHSFYPGRSASGHYTFPDSLEPDLSHPPTGLIIPVLVYAFLFDILKEERD
jgi:hypothetical protein